MHRLSSAVPSKQLEDPHLVFLASDLRYAVPHIRILLKIETVFFFSPFSKRIRTYTWCFRIDSFPLNGREAKDLQKRTNTQVAVFQNSF